MIINITKKINNKWIDIFNLGEEEQKIYAASVSKIFIAAETLRQIENNILNLNTKINIDKNNYIVAENNTLILNTEYTLDELLFTMLNHSNDTSANILIDLIDRENINNNIILKYNFENSIIKRKFLSRDKENIEYKNSKINECTPYEIKKLFQLISDKKLYSEFVSSKLLEYMNIELTKSKVNFLELNNKYIVYKGGYHDSKLQDERICRWKHHCFLYYKNNEVYYVGIFNIYKSFNDEVNVVNDFINDILKRYLE